MLNKLREKLNEGKATVNTRIWSTWPTIVEAAASTGNFDYFEFLAEYAPFSFNDLAAISIMNEMRSFHAYLPLRPL